MANPDVKITKKDCYNYLRAMVEGSSFTSDDPIGQEKLLEFIDHEVELMDMRAAKSKKYQQSHRAKDDTMSANIMQILTDADAPMSVADIAAKIDGASAQKIVYRLGVLFKNDEISKTVENVKTDKGNRRTTFYQVVKH